jgi:antitoxin HicB
MALYKIRLNLEPNEGSDVFTITSPDVPELITEGSTPEEIWHNVQDAIRSMVEIYQKQGWELPPALRPEQSIPIEEITTLQVAA